MHTFAKWRDALNLAPNVRAVEGIMRDYLEAIGPVLPALPEDCCAILAPPFDVQDAAVTLMQAELRLRGEAQEHAILHEIAHTFASAAVRMAQLHSVPIPPDPPRRNADIATGGGR